MKVAYYSLLKRYWAVTTKRNQPKYGRCIVIDFYKSCITTHERTAFYSVRIDRNHVFLHLPEEEIK